MSNLKDRLEALKKEEQTFIKTPMKRWEQLSCRQWAKDQVNAYRHNEGKTEETSFLDDIPEILKISEAKPWYQRWLPRERSQYKRLQEAYAHLKLKADLTQLLPQLNEDGQLPLTKAGFFQYYRTTYAIAKVRHYDSPMKKGWWQKRRLESHLKEAGVRTQKQLTIKENLLRQWQRLYETLRNETSFILQPTKEAEIFYLQWAEDSWFKEKIDSNPPGWLGRWQRKLDEHELSLYETQLISLLKLIGREINSSETLQAEEQPEKESAGKEKEAASSSTEHSSRALSLSEALIKLGCLLRQGLFLMAVPQKELSKTQIKTNQLYQRLGQGIMKLAKAAQQAELPQEGIVAWWQKTAAWLPDILTKESKSKWISIWPGLKDRNKTQNQPQSIRPSWSVQDFEARLQIEQWHETWQAYQLQIDDIQNDYQNLQRDEVIDERYNMVLRVEADFKSMLKDLITVGVQKEPEPEELNVLFNRLKMEVQLLKAQVNAYWDYSGKKTNNEVILESETKGKGKAFNEQDNGEEPVRRQHPFWDKSKGKLVDPEPTEQKTQDVENQSDDVRDTSRLYN